MVSSQLWLRPSGCLVAGLLPVGQAHGQDNYLLGTGDWTHALRISDDSNPGKDLSYVAVDAPAPPKGQGPFSAYLVPGHIKAKAQLLPVSQQRGFAAAKLGGARRAR